MRKIQVTIEVVPLHREDRIPEIAALVESLIKDSMGGDESDSFKDVKVVHTQETFL